MKIRAWIICILAVLIVGIAVYLLYSQYLYKNPKVSDFDISEYSECIERFPSDRNVGPVDDAYTAREKARMVWAEMWGKEAVTRCRPHVVSYDPENEVWLVKGTLPKGKLGGVDYILIEKSTGDVIAVWGTK